MKTVLKKEYLNNIIPINKINEYTNIFAEKLEVDTESCLIRMTC
jgi:hypothetical protein